MCTILTLGLKVLLMQCLKGKWFILWRSSISSVNFMTCCHLNINIYCVEVEILAWLWHYMKGQWVSYGIRNHATWAIYSTIHNTFLKCSQSKSKMLIFSNKTFTYLKMISAYFIVTINPFPVVIVCLGFFCFSMCKVELFCRNNVQRLPLSETFHFV